MLLWISILCLHLPSGAAASQALCEQRTKDNVSEISVQAEHWAVDKMAARLAAMLETANGRNLIERVEVLMPRPFDLRTTATIPQVGLHMLFVTLHP